MKWIVPLVAVFFLVVFLVIFLVRKQRPKEYNGLIVIVISLLVYHIGDLGLWAGWNYEVVRRIASIGFYFEMPFILLLMYYLVPGEKMNLFTRIATLVLMLPWLIALFLIGNSPLVYLEGQGSVNENLMYFLVLSFIVAAVFAVINGFMAGRFRQDEAGKKLAGMFSRATIILTILYVVLWSTIPAFNYDATWLFGIVSMIYVFLLWLGTRDVKMT